MQQARAVSGPAPLLIAERRLHVVQVTARKGREADLAATIKSALGVDLPPPGRANCGDGAGAIWVQPGSWLLTSPWKEEGALYKKPFAACSGLASVVDQTHGKAVLGVSGKMAREVLSKGCRVDLHPRVFAPGSAAVTPLAHINAVLVQVNDTPAYDLILPATFAETFFEWLEMSAAEYGYEFRKES